MQLGFNNNKLIEYVNNAHKFFNTFNGNINVNPDNTNIKLVIDIQSPTGSFDTLGVFSFDNTISIYLYNILYRINSRFNISTTEEFDNYFYSIMYETIIHELFHSNQMIDIYKYSNNVIYNQEQIEAPVMAKANIFMRNNKEFIESSFDFTYIEEAILLNDRFSNNSELVQKFQNVSADRIVINEIAYATSVNSSDYADICDFMTDNKNIKVVLTDYNEIYNEFAIKVDSQYNDYQLMLLFKYLAMYKLRLGQFPTMYNDNYFDILQFELFKTSNSNPFVINPFTFYYKC